MTKLVIVIDFDIEFVSLRSDYKSPVQILDIASCDYFICMV